MSDREPTDTTNLDGYGHPPLSWSRAHKALADPPTDLTHFLGTVRPDGRPHVAGVGALYMDGDLYFTSGPGARKARNLATNPACTISAHLNGIDLVLEGEATRVKDTQTLERAAAKYRQGGWPAQVNGDALTAPFSAPSAGPAPWHLYRMRFHTVFGVAGAEPFGATRWRFGDDLDKGARVSHRRVARPRRDPDGAATLQRVLTTEPAGSTPGAL